MVKPKKNDRHKVRQTLVRLPEPLREQLLKLTRENASKITEEVKIAVREHLRRKGLWPPPAKS